MKITKTNKERLQLLNGVEIHSLKYAGVIGIRKIITILIMLCNTVKLLIG